jgi:sodium transport system permease protein
MWKEVPEMNYKQLKTLYKKEILDVIRDKKTVLTMIVLPVILYPLLFVIIMQVVAFISTTQQEQTYYIAYDQVPREQRETLNDWINGDEDGLDYVIKEADTDQPEQDLEDEEIDAYLTAKVTDSQVVYEIHYLSAVTNSSTVSDMLEEEIDSYAKHLAEQNAKAAGLNVEQVLYPVKSSFQDQSSNESSMGSILGSILPFLMITSILMGSMYPAIDATAGEKERGTLETLLTLPIGNMELIMSKFFSVATIAVVSVFINVLSMSGIAAYLYATVQSLSQGTGSFALKQFIPAILISVVCIIAFALFMSAVVMCVCAFAKSFKEANNYVTPLTLVVMLTAYIGFIPNVELSTKTALLPVANICLLIKALLVFKYDFSLILLVLLSNVVYAFVAIWFLGKVYNSESILFGESAGGIQLFERRKNIKPGSLPTIQDGLLLFVVAMLLMIYVGGMMSLQHPMLGVIVPQLLFVVLPMLACLYIKGNVRQIFALKRPSGRSLLGAVCMYLGAGSLSLLLSNLLSAAFPDSSQGLSEEYATLLQGVTFPGALLLLALLPAVCEELFYRGYLFTALKQKLSLGAAILVVSLLFGMSHMSLIKLLPTAILGSALAYTIHQADSIVASSLIHFLNNGLAVVMLYYEDLLPLGEDVAAGVWVGILLLATAVFLPLAIWLLRGKQPQPEK